MGTDIISWIEIRPVCHSPANAREFVRRWHGVVNVNRLLGRNCDAFGCLFSVDNVAWFAPIAADRGLPDALSVEATQVLDDDGSDPQSFSWVTWAELNSMVPAELARYPDARLHCYSRDMSGELRDIGKLDSSSDLLRHLSADYNAAIACNDGNWPPIYEDGAEWEIHGYIYRAERLRRGDVFGPDWHLVFQEMDHLAEDYGSDGVRLVV